MTASSITRRFPRALAPFSGHHLGVRNSPIQIFNLNVGGGFVTFADEPPADATFVLSIDLAEAGQVTILVETVYRDTSGVAVRFLDLDAEASHQITHAVERSSR